MGKQLPSVLVLLDTLYSLKKYLVYYIYKY